MIIRCAGRLNFHLHSLRRQRLLQRSFSSQKTAEPLRILFCGSDEFSIASLRAVHEEQQRDVSSIASIDVVCRPPKRVGRGLKQVREVPIAEHARSISLPLHEIDTFTRWTPPIPQGSPINLVIAVSFGLLVPPRILNGAQYGGLNVHPSMLPDFYGPAPLYHTLLNKCSRTGVTIQTMHPHQFDQGVILDQTPFPGLKFTGRTVPELERELAPLGAEILVRAIRNRSFVAPHEIKGWKQSGHEGHERHSPKITSEDSHIDWNTWTADEILRKQDIIGPLWNSIEQSSQGDSRRRRLKWSTGFSVAVDVPVMLYDVEPGIPYSKTDDIEMSTVCINTSDDQTLEIEKLTLDGEPQKNSKSALDSLGFSDMISSEESIDFAGTPKVLRFV